MKSSEIYCFEIRFSIISLFVLLFLVPSALAAPQSSQQIGLQERARQMQREAEDLRNQIEQPASKIKVEEKGLQTPPIDLPITQRVLIKSINVVGVTV